MHRSTLRRRKKIRRTQKGGSRPSLAGMFRSAAEMSAGMAFYNITGHGRTTRDNVLFTVPNNTYMLFTTQSGRPTPGENPAVDKITTGSDEDRYDALFTEKGHGLQGGEYYIYEPGDLIPDYNLHFRNTPYFVALMGAFSIPMRGSDYLGLYPNVIQTLYREGFLDSVKAQLEAIPGWPTLRDASAKKLEEERKAFQTWSAVLGNNAKKNPDGPERAVVDRVEEIARGGPLNLIGDELSPDKRWSMRLSNILRLPAMMPADGRSRFFIMHFCRVSYQDIIGDYAGKVPIVIRALSASQKAAGPLQQIGKQQGTCCFQKCSTNQDNALNLKKIIERVCSMPTAKKLHFLRKRHGLLMVNRLKKVVKTDWGACLRDTYEHLTLGERYALTSAYLGAMTIEELEDLTKVDLPEFDRLRAMMQKYTVQFQETKEMKRKAIEIVYNVLASWVGRRLQGIAFDEEGRLIPKNDYLLLTYQGLPKIRALMEFMGVLVPGEDKEETEEMKTRIRYRKQMRAIVQKLARDDELEDAELRIAIASVFKEYVGVISGEPDYDPFKFTYEADTSIPLEVVSVPLSLPMPAAAAGGPVLRRSSPTVRERSTRKRNPWSDDSNS